MLKAPRIMLESTAYNGKSTRYDGESTAYNRLQPPRILAKAPHIMPKPPPYNAKSTQQNAVYHFNPAMALAFHKRPKMKDHIAYLPYA
jgi:hypothetical protein